LAESLAETGKPSAVEPEREDAWQVAQREGRHEDALKLLRIAASTKPDDPAVLLSLAGELMRAGRPQTAVVHLDRLLKRQPGSAEALLMRGTIRLSQQKYEEAVDDLLPVATLENAPPSTVSSCGVALLMSGDHAGVDALAGEIINRGGPQVGEAFYVRCLSRLKRGLFDEAKADLASLEKSEADSSMVESARAAVARAAPPEKQERPDSE